MDNPHWLRYAAVVGMIAAFAIGLCFVDWRVAIALSGGLTLFLLLYLRLHPDHWRRRLIGVVIGGWLGTTIANMVNVWVEFGENTLGGWTNDPPIVFHLVAGGIVVALTFAENVGNTTQDKKTPQLTRLQRFVLAQRNQWVVSLGIVMVATVAMTGIVVVGQVWRHRILLEKIRVSGETVRRSLRVAPDAADEPEIEGVSDAAKDLRNTIDNSQDRLFITFVRDEIKLAEATLIAFAGAQALVRQKYEEALAAFDEAETLLGPESQTSRSAIVLLGNVQISKGNLYARREAWRLAYRNYTKALHTLLPDSSTAEAAKVAYINRGKLMEQMGHIDLSVADYEMAVEIHQSHELVFYPQVVASVANVISWYYAVERRVDLARTLHYAELANELTEFSHPAKLDTLAVALAINGDFDRAIATATKALELSRRSSDKKIIGGHLECFRRKEVFFPSS